ncbi:hypothetical protein EKPJFOCH_4048 [Methylobacterium thuringiense]|uniref:Uncharacterized protein n=1 Tax=Methylobacterium thuringiense TaxID=1003091 RepID=A0ABQ4TSB7_9HYPH|nr:hypothetical protein EKPJFOCH_4048 [Methylobacterium thuringiense]
MRTTEPITRKRSDAPPYCAWAERVPRRRPGAAAAGSITIRQAGLRLAFWLFRQAVIAPTFGMLEAQSRQTSGSQAVRASAV